MYAHRSTSPQHLSEMPVKNKKQVICEESNHMFIYLNQNKMEHRKTAVNQGWHSNLLYIYKQWSLS